MKTLCIFLFALLPVIMFAQDEDDEVVLPQEVSMSRNEAISKGVVPMGATPVWTAVEHDFGMLDAGKDIAHTFVVKNTGSTPLQIKSVKTRNANVTVLFPATPIATGTSANILVKYINAPSGNFTEYVTVFTNSEDGADVLSIAGQVVMPVAEAK